MMAVSRGLGTHSINIRFTTNPSCWYWTYSQRKLTGDYKGERTMRVKYEEMVSEFKRVLEKVWI